MHVKHHSSVSGQMLVLLHSPCPCTVQGHWLKEVDGSLLFFLSACQQKGVRKSSDLQLQLEKADPSNRVIQSMAFYFYSFSALQI